MKINVDVVTEEISLEETIAELKTFDIKTVVLNEVGPGGGWPELQLEGNREDLEKWLEKAGFEEIEVYETS